MTLTILLAWLPLSALLALVVGGCIRLGSGEPDPRPAPKHASSRPQNIFHEQASA